MDVIPNMVGPMSTAQQHPLNGYPTGYGQDVHYELMWVPMLRVPTGPQPMEYLYGTQNHAHGNPYLTHQVHPTFSSLGCIPYNHASMIQQSSHSMMSHPPVPQYPHSLPYSYPGSVPGGYLPYGYGYNQSMCVADRISWSSTSMAGVGPQPQPYISGSGSPQMAAGTSCSQSSAWDSQHHRVLPPPYPVTTSHGYENETSESVEGMGRTSEREMTSRHGLEQRLPFNTHQIPESSCSSNSNCSQDRKDVTADPGGNLESRSTKGQPSKYNNDAITAVENSRQNPTQFKSYSGSMGNSLVADENSKEIPNGEIYSHSNNEVSVRDTVSAATRTSTSVQNQRDIDVVGLTSAAESEDDESSDCTESGDENPEDYNEYDDSNTMEVISQTLDIDFQNERPGLEEVRHQSNDIINGGSKLECSNQGKSVLDYPSPNAPFAHHGSLILRIPITKQKITGKNIPHPQVLSLPSATASGSGSSTSAVSGEETKKRKKRDVTTRSGRRVRARLNVKVSTTSGSSLEEDSQENKPARRKKMAKGQYACKDCDRVFCYYSQLKIHEKRHQIKQCPHCDSTFIDRQDFITHQHEKHKGPMPRGNSNHQRKVLKCNICTIVFETQLEFNSHWAIHNAEGKYACGICFTTFWHWQSRRAHFKHCYEEKQKRLQLQALENKDQVEVSLQKDES